MGHFLIHWFTAIGLATTLAALAVAPAQAEKRYIVVAAIEPKGGATVEKEPFPSTPLPEGKGYVLKKPDQTGRWEISVYVFEPRQIFVNQGDEVTLEFVGINGAAHPITLAGYDQTLELKRGQAARVTFLADKAGTFPIVCSAHHPTMVAELIVATKE